MALAKFYRQESRNIAGNLTMFLTESDQLYDVTVTNGEVSTITMVGQYEFLQIQADQSSIQRTQAAVRANKSFMNFEHSLTFAASKASAEVNVLSSALNDASPCGVMAIIVDENAQCWLMGWSENEKKKRPLFLETEDFDSGATVGEGNSTSYLLKAVNDQIDLPLNSTLNTEVLTAIRNAMGTGIGIGLPFTGGGGIMPQYQLVLDAMGTEPSAAILAAQNDLVFSLVNAGVWDKLDIFYMLAQTTSADALINWKAPGTYDLTISGTPIFTALEGMAGDAAAAYLDTSFIPGTNGVNLTLDDLSIGVYNRSSRAADSAKCIMGCRGVTTSHMLALFPLISATDCRTQLSTTTVHELTTNTSAGFFAGYRSASNATELRHNLLTTSNDTNGSQGLPTTRSLYLLAYQYNVPTSFTDDQISMAFAGAALSNAEHTAFVNAFETYMDSNGKGVIT